MLMDVQTITEVTSNKGNFCLFDPKFDDNQEKNGRNFKNRARNFFVDSKNMHSLIWTDHCTLF